MEKKMIKKDYYEMIKEICIDNPEIVKFCNHEIELLDKKSSKSTLTKTQKENEKIKIEVINALTEIAKPVTITEMQELNTEMANYSNQKLSALLKQLVESNQVVKTVDKKKSYFTVA